MVPRENENKAYAKFGGTSKKYYGIITSGLFLVPVRALGPNGPIHYLHNLIMHLGFGGVICIETIDIQFIEA